MHELQGKISIYVYASGGKTARAVVQILLIVVFFSGVSGGGGGGCNNVNVDTFLILAFVIFCVFVATL